MEGLSTLGVLDMVKQKPQIMRDAFIPANQPLTAEDLEQLFSIIMSASGTHRHREELRLIPLWRDYLLDLQDEGIELFILTKLKTTYLFNKTNESAFILSINETN